MGGKINLKLKVCSGRAQGKVISLQLLVMADKENL
jgi:hypothetical protein